MKSQKWLEEMTDPIFIVGSGRSGTRTLFRMLAGSENVEIHHEYNVISVQKLAVLYKSGLVDRETATAELRNIYEPAIHYSAEPIWLDSSNKCSWLIDLLAEIFPSAKFILVVRDGRKVVSSFYYKLREEMYDDLSNKITTAYLTDPANHVQPPLEKKFWWYVPVDNKAVLDRFKTYDRLQRVSFHWAEINRTIRESFLRMPANRSLSIRLEDLITKWTTLQRMCHFIGIENDEIYRSYLTVPRNVFFPLNFDLTQGQLKKFYEICSDEMDIWGYDEKTHYKVEY